MSSGEHPLTCAFCPNSSSCLWFLSLRWVKPRYGTLGHRASVTSSLFLHVPSGTHLLTNIKEKLNSWVPTALFRIKPGSTDSELGMLITPPPEDLVQIRGEI